MIIYGINPVTEALESRGTKLERIMMTRGKSNPRLQKIIDLARSRGIAIRFESEEAIQRTSSHARHQDVVAVLSEVGYKTVEEILQAKPSLLLLVEGVEDPHNLGAVLRTAEAAGVGGVLIPERRTCGITPAVFKSSAGGAAHLRIAKIGNVPQTMERLKESGFWLVGLDMEGPLRPDELDVSMPLAIVIGGEHRGVRRLVKEKCDFLVSLPMRGHVSSLNLSVAAGILLYQIILKREKATEAQRHRESL